MNNRVFRWIITIALVGLVIYYYTNRRSENTEKQLIYSQVLEEIDSGNVEKVEFIKDRLTGWYTKQLPGMTEKTFTATLPPSPDAIDRLVRRLEDKKIRAEFKHPFLSDFSPGIFLSITVPLVLVGLLWIFGIRWAQSSNNQAYSFSRSRARRLTDSLPKVTFDDIGGVDDAKQEVQEIVEFLMNARKFQALGAKIPKGVLLFGPPGCGKTMLARAIAGEAGVPFFHISGSDFVEMYVGVGAGRVRDLFDTAKSNRPALIFIDEIDIIGRQPGTGEYGRSENEQTMHQLFVEMDGFDPNAGVITIAATNRPDVLDPALLRPGRFDRRVVVDAPDSRGRRDIFRVHLRGKPLEFDSNEMERERTLEILAKLTPGFTGADIANLVNETAILAARRDKNRITMQDFQDSIDRVIAGLERKSRILTEAVRRRSAYHEVGHALVSELMENTDPVHKVSILPRGMALGYTISLPTTDQYSHTRNELEDTIAMDLAGRVAEELVFGDMDTGAANDLKKSTDTARAMVCEYGMSERLGPLYFGRQPGKPQPGGDLQEDRNYSEEVAQAIDAEVHAIVDRNYNRAKQILEIHREKMDTIVEALMLKETLERDEFVALLHGADINTIIGSPASPSDSGTPPPDPPARPRREPRLRPEPGTT